MVIELQNESAATQNLCAGIKCKCLVSNLKSTDDTYCSSVCKNSVVDQTIDQVNDQCDCNHPACMSQGQASSSGSVMRSASPISI